MKPGEGVALGGRYRLDYILFSDEIMNSPYGSPTGEIYNSEFDGEGVGLDKPGPVPPSSTSMDASDHRMLFADFHLIDVVPGITPVAILSEIVDDSSESNANYVEIHNTGAAVVWSGMREPAELYWEQLKAAGLTMAPLERG